MDDSIWKPESMLGNCSPAAPAETDVGLISPKKPLSK